MTLVLVRCSECEAEPSVPVDWITLIVDLTEDRAAVMFACPACGAVNDIGPMDTHVQTVLLGAGCQLAARV